MKKQISRFLYLLIIFLLFLNPSVNQTGAFLDDDLWLNLYRNLDKWFEELNLSQYEYEIAWWEEKDLSKNINRILEEELELWKDCIKSNIDSKTIEQISNWDISTLSRFLEEDCFEEQKISTENLNNLSREINEINTVYKEKAKEKSKKIYDISRISLYTDGTLDNSPFDLINDLQEINEVLFTDEITYEWEESNFLSNFEDNPYITPLFLELNTDPENSNETSPNDYINTDPSEEQNNTDEETTNNDSPDAPVYTNDWNFLICPDDNSTTQSWLNASEISDLQDSFTPSWTSWHVKLNDTNKLGLIGYEEEDYFRIPSTLADVDFTSSPYSAVNDNSEWPCNKFFCIIVNFKIHDQELLWYWESISIQNIINTSNGHLKKWANTSLEQWKMSTNNFEIWLRNVSLPDRFHMWFVITYKSPPLYNLENIIADKNAHKEESQTKNMLTDAYKNLWFDYSRANDINIIVWKDKEEKTIVDSSKLTPAQSAIKDRELRELEIKLKEKNFYKSEQLDKTINGQELDRFYEQLIEVERSVWWIEDYTSSLDWIIRKMREIPIFKE